MPKKKKGANRTRDKGVISRELIFKEYGQDYAIVTRVLGNCRFITRSYVDNKSRLSIMRKAIRKKGWIRSNDVVLISIRDFQDSKCDIIHLYRREEAQKLVHFEEISRTFLQSGVDKCVIGDENNEDDNVVFDFESI